MDVKMINNNMHNTACSAGRLPLDLLTPSYYTAAILIRSVRSNAIYSISGEQNLQGGSLNFCLNYGRSVRLGFGKELRY